MSETVIKTENLGKRYRIGAAQTDTLAERLQRVATAPVRALRHRDGDRAGRDAKPTIDDRELWALRGVSLEIARGKPSASSAETEPARAPY